MMYNLASDDIRIIEDIVKRHSKKMGNGRCALVVDDALGFGLARMYELIGGESVHQEVGVFYESDKAIEWLNTQNGDSVRGTCSRGALPRFTPASACPVISIA
jgi:hypothetical protein